MLLQAHILLVELRARDDRFGWECAGMRERIDHAVRQASKAREQAEASSDSAIKAQWMKLARMWDDLIREYGEFQGLQDEP